MLMEYAEILAEDPFVTSRNPPAPGVGVPLPPSPGHEASARLTATTAAISARLHQDSTGFMVPYSFSTQPRSTTKPLRLGPMCFQLDHSCVRGLLSHSGSEGVGQAERGEVRLVTRVQDRQQHGSHVCRCRGRKTVEHQISQ